LLSHKRDGKTKPWQAAAVVVILVLAAGYLGIISIPGLTPGSGVRPSSTTSANGNSNSCTYNPIQSELTSSNGQTITTPHVTSYVQNGAGQWVVFQSGSGALTQNSLNTASAYTGLPVYQTYYGTTTYNTTVAINSASQANVVDPQTGVTMLSITCATPAGSSNNVPTIQAIATAFTGPASGRTATTNVENVLNSAISQTNSAPAAFPTSAPATWADYVQVFSTNTAAMRAVQIPASTNLPITDFGINGVQSSTIVKSGLVSYQGYAIVSFNQTAIQFTGPAGTIPLTLHGATGSVAFLVPLSSLGVSAASGVSTSAPFVGSTFTFSVQELVGATGHHVDMAILVGDNLQSGYIQQYFNAPAVTSYHAAGNTYGFTGFTGIVPPTSANAPVPIIEQQSYSIMTY
jgi:hypothetical protein